MIRFQKTKTVITVDYAVRKKIMEVCCCTYPTVRKALRGMADNELAEQIRKVAIEHGGIEYQVLPKK